MKKLKAPVLLLLLTFLFCTFAHALTVKGAVLSREETWDRRSNPLMGRPDILKEIRFKIRVEKVVSGSLPAGTGEVTASVTGEKMIIKHKMIFEGASGAFILSGALPSFALESYEADKPMPKRTQAPPPKPAPYRKKTVKIPLFPEGVNAAEIRKSKELQEKAVAAVAARYRMKQASFVSKTGYQGPEPPPGGYFYWGVKGRINGTWHIWQSGSLKQGEDVEDYHRYQKCNSEDTLITTPYGLTYVSRLKTGDYVISGGGPARIIKTSKVKAPGHTVCRITFNDGTTLEISPGHPMSGGITAGSLKPGAAYDGRKVIRLGFEPYSFSHTYDILPGSPSGTYLANGITTKSTLSPGK